MSSLFDLTYLAGYFSILIISLILAIIFAKNLHSWIWYSIGAIITLISLIVKHISCYNYYESFHLANDEMSPYWSFYIVSLLVSALIIFYRYSTSTENTDEPNSKKSKFSETLSKVPSSTAGKTWECKKCGTNNSQSSIQCKNCGEYK